MQSFESSALRFSTECSEIKPIISIGKMQLLDLLKKKCNFNWQKCNWRYRLRCCGTFCTFHFVDCLKSDKDRSKSNINILKLMEKKFGGIRKFSLFHNNIFFENKNILCGGPASFNWSTNFFHKISLYSFPLFFGNLPYNMS